MSSYSFITFYKKAAKIVPKTKERHLCLIQIIFTACSDIFHEGKR